MLRLPGGPAWFRADAVEPRGNGQGALPVTVSVSGLADLPPLLGRIRRLFDLDADPLAVDAALSCDAAFARLAADAPGLRLPGSLEPHETLIRAIVGQQVTVAAATGALNRLANAGPQVDAAGTGLTRFFPSAQELAHAPEPLLRGPRRRNDALRTAARMLSAGSLELGIGSEPGELRAALLQLDGIGPWTADYVAMRVLGHPDVHLPSDSAVRSGWSRLASGTVARQVDGGATTRAVAAGDPSLAEAMERVRPWRSYATLHLWRIAAQQTARAAARKGTSGDAA